MNDFVLNIEGYEGPIDLLLELAKKQEVDLKHIDDKYTLYKDAFLEQREFEISDGNLSDSDITSDIEE